MTTKILTEQPQARRRTVQHAVTTSFVAVLVPPLFSIPMADEDTATADPADADRELRAGEIFIAAPILFSNTNAASRTITIELLSEGGVTSNMANNIIVPPNDVFLFPPGLSLFKRNLASPAANGDVLRVRASATGVQMTATIVEREALDHAPDATA